MRLYLQSGQSQPIMSSFVDPEKEINIFILREKKKVLFAEGNKDFVDGLFGSMLAVSYIFYAGKVPRCFSSFSLQHKKEH